MPRELPRDASDDERHRVGGESEPFLAASARPPSVAPPPQRDDTELDGDGTLARSDQSRSRSESHRSRHTSSASSHSHVSARLLHALSPQLSQWLQPRAPPQSSSQSASHASASRANGELTNQQVTIGGDNGVDAILLGLQPTLSADVIAARRLDSGEAIETSHHTSRRRSESTERPETERLSATLRVNASTATRPQLDRDADDLRVLPSSPVITVAPASPMIPESHESDLPSRAESPRSTTSSDDVSQHEELSTMDELSTLFRRCHHSLPFAALFLVYFAYQHATGILVFIIGSVAIVGLDERLRTQIALKQDSNRVFLMGIFAMSVVDSVVVSVIGSGDLNPVRHVFTQRLEAPTAQIDTSGALFVDVVWLVLVNDFILRFWSLAAKALVALLQSETWWLCGLRRRPVVVAGVAAASHSSTVTPTTVDGDDLEQGSRRRLSRSNVAFYRRKRKLYGIIELSSIFARSLLAGVPWCSYYQLCSSKFVGDVFTFVYIFGKGIILATQGRQLLQLVRSFVTQGLEHATYVTRDELEHAGSPDCSICYEAMLHPVKLSCSHLFCEECVMEWFDRERSCPLCRAAIIAPASTTSPSGSGTEIKPQFLDGRTSLFPQLF